MPAAFTTLQDSVKVDANFCQQGKLEAIGRLAGGVAHDFNNLLTVILGCGEMLMRKHKNDEESRMFIEEIQRAGEKATGLSRQLLLFSRKQTVQPVLLNLNNLVTDFTKMLRRLIRENIELTLNLDPDLNWVKADPGQIEQILMNLVVNARDAMPKGGKLRIDTTNVKIESPAEQDESRLAPGSYVLLSVRDTGCGMDDDVLSHLFEPFFTTKEPGKGTGLGLATVYGIVKQSKGLIRVASKVGVGTRFRIYLPAAPRETAPQASRTSGALTGYGTGTILVVEDDNAVRSMAHHALRGSGYNVLSANNGFDALAIADEHPGPIDLVLTDVIMPIMSGTQLVKILASKRPTTRFLFMSGYTDSVLAQHNELDIRAAFLEKPFSAVGLIAAIRKALTI